MALQPLETQELRADRPRSLGIDQYDRHGLEIASRDRRRFDNGRIHAGDILELKSVHDLTKWMAELVEDHFRRSAGRWKQEFPARHQGAACKIAASRSPRFPF